MLIKPNLKDEEIIACLRDAYGLTVDKVTFLPLGADFNTAVYRITTSNQNELVCFDDNIMHEWEMNNNDMAIYYYRAKSDTPINRGTYCVDELDAEGLML